MMGVVGSTIGVMTLLLLLCFKFSLLILTFINIDQVQTSRRYDEFYDDGIIDDEWFYAPASLLFPPTGRSAEVQCNFDDNDGACPGWRIWRQNENNLNGTYFPSDNNNLLSTWPDLSSAATNHYRIVVEQLPIDGGQSGNTMEISYFQVEKTSPQNVYVMSQEVTFSLTSRSNNNPSICFTYFYKIMATAQGRMMAIILARSQQTNPFYIFSSTSHVVWNETGKWPNTWSWLVNTVQFQLPRNTTWAKILFVLNAGDGLAALDDVEIFNSSCNLRPVSNNTAARPSDPTTARAKSWPGFAIPYDVRPGFSVMQLTFLELVLADVGKRTCVSFTKRRDETDWVEFVHTPEGCTSQRIGFFGGKQRVHLADNCFDKSTLSHELLHVVGLFHEHQRPDRDEFINILWENVDPAYREQFTKFQTMDERLTAVRYDVASVMHYRDNAFAARRGMKTMQARNNTNSSSSVLGNIQGPIESDYQKIGNLYCNGAVKPVDEANMPRSPPFRPRLWSGGEIPVEFDPQFSDDQVAAIYSVIDDLNRKTCLKFRPKQTTDVDFVFFQLTNSECFSRSGRTGGRQVVSFYSGTCFARHLLYWVILHVVGLDAEHRRPDRDQYVIVNVDNISERNLESFQRFESMDWRVMSVPYDVNSVLHYGSTAFAKRSGLITLTDRNNGSRFLGNKNGPTPLDYAKIIRLYNCSAQYWKDVPTRPEAGNGSNQNPRHVPIQSNSLTSNNEAAAGAAVRSSASMIAPLWPQARIPYLLNMDRFSMAERHQIIRVLTDVNSKTCLQFVPRLSDEQNYVEFVKESPNGSLVAGACRASFYGFKRGRQTIMLPSERCFASNYYIYLALLSTIGVPEEHRRPDRDNYIQILWNNVNEQAKQFFTSLIAIDRRLLTVPYDINSITHYSGEAFAKNTGQKTIISRINASLPLGNPNGPTALDYEKVAKLYCN